MGQEIHKPLETDEIYSKLRQAHSILKDIYFSDKWEEKYEHKQRNAIELVNLALYNAESLFTDF